MQLHDYYCRINRNCFIIGNKGGIEANIEKFTIEPQEFSVITVDV